VVRAGGRWRDLGVAPDVRRHADDVRQAGERARVVERQRPCELLGRPGEGAPPVLVLPGVDADDVGAELAELAEHEAVHAFADRGEQDHRRDADGDAEQGQEAAQAVGGDGAQWRAGGSRQIGSMSALHQGLHRVEPGGAAGRHDAEQQAGDQRGAQSGDHRPVGRVGREDRERTGASAKAPSWPSR
jgi:hypothetical protein